MAPKLTDRDYKWIIALLTLSMLFITSLFFGGKDSEIVSYMGFAGTLVSIILSVLAIMYTYYVTGISSSQADKLTMASESLESVMKDFHTTRDLLTAVVRQVQEAGHKVETVGTAFSNVAAALMTQSQEVPSANKVEVVQPADLKAAIGTASHVGLVLLLAASLSEGKNRPFGDLVTALRAQGLAIDTDYSWGFLVGFGCSGLMNTKQVTPTLLVAIQNREAFVSAVAAEFEKRIAAGTNNTDLLRKCRDTVVSFFAGSAPNH